MNEVGRLRRQSLVSAFRPAILDRHVLAVYVAGFLQSLAKRGYVERILLRRCAVEEPDHRHRRLLRPRRQRPRGRAADQRDELASSHGAPASRGITTPGRTTITQWSRVRCPGRRRASPGARSSLDPRSAEAPRHRPAVWRSGTTLEWP